MAPCVDNVPILSERHRRAGGVDGTARARLRSAQARRRDQRRLDFPADVAGQVLQVVGEADVLRCLAVVDENDLGAEPRGRAQLVPGLEGAVALRRVHPRSVAVVVAGTDEARAGGARETGEAGPDKGRLRRDAVGQDVVDVDAVADVRRGAVGVEGLDLAGEDRAGAAEGASRRAGHEHLRVAFSHHPHPLPLAMADRLQELAEHLFFEGIPCPHLGFP